MHKVAAPALAALTTALLSCGAPPSRNSAAPAPLAYESNGPITRAALPPPVGHDFASNSSSSNDDSANAAEAARLGWHASPRWAAIRGKDSLVEPDDPQAKFKAAKAKARKVGVENLSDEDVEGLNPAQLKELRGY